MERHCHEEDHRDDPHTHPSMDPRRPMKRQQARALKPLKEIDSEISQSRI